jgi:PAS domain S-box-containing protein
LRTRNWHRATGPRAQGITMSTASTKKIDLILNSTHDGMIAVNEDGIVTLFNKAAERITGLKSEAVLGRSAIDVIPNTRLHIILESGESELNSRQFIGTTTIVTNRMPLLNSEGEIIGAVAVFRDITEMMTLMDQVADLGTARNLLEAMIESMEIAISVADENGKNIMVNTAYVRLTGLPREAVVGKHITVDIAEGESMHQKVLSTGKPIHNMRMKIGRDKKEVIVNVAPIFVDGVFRGSVGTIQDITEIMVLTKELARAQHLIRQLKARYTWADIIGVSPAMVAAKEQARRAAETPATVLLRGESGTGKELFAHAIHNASRRHKGQFVRVNCAALSEHLLESELFGYAEGAFTGALKGGKIGLFEEAHGGTLFLDEIGEISLSLQRKLLRVLQEREIVRVGSTYSVLVDVRMIAATNTDLERRVKDGAFKRDLYYRLNVLPINTPPLRMISEDIPLLVEHIIFKLNQSFGRQVKGVSPETMDALISHEWPGNVRELENVIGRAMINMRPQDIFIDRKHLPFLECEPLLQAPSSQEQKIVSPLDQVLGRAERSAIIAALQEAGGNRVKAAGLLGIGVRNLFYKIKKHGIKPK